jgi:hypothetical protein
LGLLCSVTREVKKHGVAALRVSLLLFPEIEYR